MKKSLIVLFLLVVGLLSGCTVNGVPNLVNYGAVSAEVRANTTKMFFGVPFYLSFDKSAARLNEDWIITAKHDSIAHEAFRDKENIYEHPTCDVVLIREKGDNIVPLGYAYLGKTLFSIGYPVTPIGPLPMAINEGVAETNIEVLDQGCVFTMVSSSVMHGMSGGGVYNEAGELVGINSHISDGVYANGEKYRIKTLFLSLNAIGDWIYEITGIDTFVVRRY